MPKIGVVLSGCGFMDGAEIHEATLTLLYLDQAGADILCMAPDLDAIEVVDHARKEPTGEIRNVFSESGRIARGDLLDLATVRAENLDGLIFPGGFGAAKNLCDWAKNGPACTVHPDVERLIREMYDAGKPQGFICIAPVLAARILGEHGVRLTVGKDEATASAIGKTGAVHQSCEVDEVAVDMNARVVSTPAYMLGPSIAPVAKGVRKLVQQVLEWC